MTVVVPFAVGDPKTRLAPLLEPREREAFARAMLADVLSAIGDAGREPLVLATDPLSFDDVPLAAGVAEPSVRVDDRPLTEAVNAVLAEGPPVAVVMADLALATPDALDRLFAAGEGTDRSVAIAPGRGGGTNALVVRHPEFRVDYHGASVRDHRRIADEVGAAVRTVDSFRLGTDVDEPADLAEVLLHGTGAAREWLVDAGFELAVEESRVGVRRG